MPMVRKRPVRPEDFFLLKNVTDPQVSPDGRQVAYCLSWPDKDANETRVRVYVAPMNASAPARRFTQGTRITARAGRLTVATWRSCRTVGRSLRSSLRP